MDDDRRVRTWERRGTVPLLIASMLFLTSYAVQVLVPDLSPGWRLLLPLVMVVTWLMFVADYAVRLALSGNRWRFVHTHWLDLVVLVLPLLRPLRLVQTYTKVRERRERPRLGLEAAVMVYAGLTTVLLGFAASLTVYHDERDAPGATIRTFGDAVWWACSAVTTTGYGDVVPVTPRGRTVAVGVMVIGVALIGAVVASFSSWLMQSFRRDGTTGRPPERG